MSGLRTVYIDECGYTGPDLMQADQPVFSLAALAMEPGVCDDLKQTYFSRVKADELKYSKMSKIPIHQHAIVSFMKYMSTQQQNCGLFYAHKSYAITCKIVDVLVETSMDKRGFDLYDRGGNLALANLLHLTIDQIGGKAFGRSLRVAFQEMARNPTYESVTTFWRILGTPMPEPLQELLQMVAMAMIDVGQRYVYSLDKSALDVVMPPTLALVSRIGKLLGTEMMIVHDQSSHLSKHKALWDAFTSPTAPPALVGYDRRTFSFPIGVQRTEIVSSKLSAGIQLADVLAGALGHMCESYMQEGELSDYEIRLRDIVGEWSVVGHMWPAAEFSPEDLNTTEPNAGDAIEYVSKMVAESRAS